ncbi:MAG: hypothetical protein HZA94_00615 [Candidatus Vogelbacteria bacterium]|nr:hypothetical protein [Candidatus Vogelbacteria bacterium]
MENVRPTIWRCFVRFYGVNSLKKAMSLAKRLIDRFSSVEIIGWSESEKHVIRIVMHIPEDFIMDTYSLPGVSMLIVKDGNCPATHYEIKPMVGQIKLFSPYNRRISRRLFNMT